MKKLLFIVFAIQGLVGCDLLPTSEFSSNNKKDYLQSKNGKPLVIEKPLSDDNISNFYQLPDQTQSAKISTRPPVVQTEE